MPVFVAHTKKKKKKERKKKENKCHVCNKEPYLQASLWLLYLDWSFRFCASLSVTSFLWILRGLFVVFKKVGAPQFAGNKKKKKKVEVQRGQNNSLKPLKWDQALCWILVWCWWNVGSADLLWGSERKLSLRRWYLAVKSIYGWRDFFFF